MNKSADFSGTDDNKVLWMRSLKALLEMPMLLNVRNIIPLIVRKTEKCCAGSKHD